ncbi:protein MIZU-KUSSEI 1-like [Miscanthus floridulus]|uniref:protein MIZU-KUSSEI 1-like n=1 Tax=Miscanthus floridulus TaxID=154761 RepID=UPI00345B3587
MPSLIDYSPAALRSLLRPSSDERRTKLSGAAAGAGAGAGAGGVLGLFKMFKLLPVLTTGCKMAAMLGRHHNHRPALLADHAPTVTLFGHRRGRLSLAIHEDTRCPPAFLIELPMLAAALHREMATGTVRLALESDTARGVGSSSRRRRPLLEEYVWAVYCNGRSAGYAIRRKDASDDERHVLRLLRGVSMGAGVLPPPPDERAGAAARATPGSACPDGELTYMRARVERVVGSKDSEAFYMINPDDGSGNAAARGGDSAPELSVFFVRNK